MYTQGMYGQHAIDPELGEKWMQANYSPIRSSLTCHFADIAAFMTAVVFDY